MRQYSNKEIRSKAREIINANNNLSIEEVLDKLAKDNEFKVIKFKDSEETNHIKGAVIINENGKKVFINDKLSNSESLFVYAHEISHILLHSDNEYMDFVAKPKLQKQMESDEETEANMLAYELIFPLAKFVDSYDKNDGNIIVMSQEFSASDYRTRERLLFLRKHNLLSLMYN